MTRTNQQNKALHKFCAMLADELNARGLDMRKVLKPGVEIPWDGERVKESVFKPVMNAMYPEKDSTTQLETDEVSRVYDVINRHMIDKFEVAVPFPSKENDNG